MFRFKWMTAPVLGITFGILTLGCFISCSQPKDEQLPDIDKIRAMGNNQAAKVSFIFSQNGYTKASLEADTFIQNNEAKPPYSDLKKHLKLTSFDSLLHVESTVTADFARYYPDNGNIIIRGNIVVHNKKGDKLETEELIWNQQLSRFYTDKFVKITMDDQILFGDGLEANQDFTWFRIQHQTGSLPVDKSAIPVDD